MPGLTPPTHTCYGLSSPRSIRYTATHPQAYQLPVRYSEEVINPSNFKRSVSVSNLSDETVALINRVYARDFELFGYKQKLPFESWDSYSFNATTSTSSFGVLPHAFR